jgi:plasmid maintenance system antidote protein VapI
MGFPPRQMSGILGKDESVVSKILKGGRSITIEHARKFGRHFGVNPGLFLRLAVK